MHTCEFCGSELTDYPSFCGQCGRAPNSAMKAQTMDSGLQMPDVQDIQTATSASVPGNSTPYGMYNQQSFTGDTPTASLNQEEEEKERRRRAAILGMGVPLLGGLAVEGQPNAGSVPMVQGSPQVGGVPTVQGTPQPPAGSIGQGLYSNPTIMAPQIPFSTPVSPLPTTPTTSHHPHHPHHPHPPHHKPHGCALAFIIAAISIPVLIILSFLSLGLTVFAPGLSLNGSTNVVQGGTFALHGNHFIPGSSVTLTLDDTIPLYFSSRSLPVQSAYTANTAMQILSIDTQQAKQLPYTSNTTSVGGDGTFAVTITANPGWSIGKHSIKASESLTHRSANLDFTIYLAGTTPTPVTTSTTSPSPTTTLTPTATSTLAGLSCVNPSSLSLGPVSQGYNQPVSAQVTLCTTGTGTVIWTATWDQNAAHWLQLDHTSGQISALPASQTTLQNLCLYPSWCKQAVLQVTQTSSVIVALLM